jgi:hypothetical protein
MKKVLVLLLSVCFASSGFATNSWDRPLGKSAFSDPYVTNYNVSVNSAPGYPNYYVLVQADFNQTVGVPYYVVIQCYGVWDGVGPSYKQFTLLYSSVQWHKTLTYYMKASEECYPETEELVDYGPQ